jgi:hypothetical protein
MFAISNIIIIIIIQLLLFLLNRFLARMHLRIGSDHLPSTRAHWKYKITHRLYLYY